MVGLGTLLVALAAALIVFSQTVAFVGDEAFHVTAARLVAAGRTPYLDFFHQHPPLFVWVTAAWFRTVGDSWKSAHVLSTLFTTMAMGLSAMYVHDRAADPVRRRWTAAFALVFFGLHEMVVRLGTVGRPYGLCLFLLVAAALLAIRAARPECPWAAANSGLAAGAAAASSLLTVATVPILLAWIVRRTSGSRRRASAWGFIAGAALAWIPVAVLAVRAPRPVLFDIFEYHLLHRHDVLVATLAHDLSTLYETWVQSPQQIALVSLAGAAFAFPDGRADRDPRLHAELRLFAQLGAGLALTAAASWPTFREYFVLVIPSLVIPAAIGVVAIAWRLWPDGPPRAAGMMVAVLFGAWVIAPVYQSVRGEHWASFEDVGRVVNRVTPPGQLVYANELITFAAGRLPAPGLENVHARRLRLDPRLAAELHAVPDDVLENALRSGRFSTAVVYPGGLADTTWVGEFFGHRERVRRFDVYWGWKAASGSRERDDGRAGSPPTR